MLLEALGFILLAVVFIAIYTINRTYYFCRTNKENITNILDGIYNILEKRNLMLDDFFVFLHSLVSNHLDANYNKLRDEIKNLGGAIKEDFLKFKVDEISVEEEDYRENLFKLFEYVNKIPNMEYNLDVHEYKKQITNLNLDLLTYQDKYNSYVKQNNNLLTKFPYKYYNKYLELFELPLLKFKKLVEM